MTRPNFAPTCVTCGASDAIEVLWRCAGGLACGYVTWLEGLTREERELLLQGKCPAEEKVA